VKGFDFCRNFSFLLSSFLAISGQANGRECLISINSLAILLTQFLGMECDIC